MKNLHPDLIAKGREAESAKELLELAEANGVEMTEEEAKTCFAKLNQKYGELSDDELDNVSGGCGGSVTPPIYAVGDHVMKRGLVVCNLQYPFTCRSSYWVVDRIEQHEAHDNQYFVHCPVCGASVGMWEGMLVKV